MLLLVLLVVMGGSSGVCQEFENLDNSYQESDPEYYVRLSLEYLDNERDIIQTGYSDLSQSGLQKEGSASLKLYFFYLDGLYKSFDSKVESGDDKTHFSDERSSISARAEFLKYFYLFAQQRNQDWEYDQVDDRVETLFENETLSTSLQGIGLVFGDWRLGFAPAASYQWMYQVDLDQQTAVEEEIEYDIGVWELAKTASDTQGPFYEVGIRHWRDSGIDDDREGSLERMEAFILVGMGFSKRTHIYLGGKQVTGEIKSILPGAETEAVRKSALTNSVVGVGFGIGEESAVYAEQRMIRRKIDFESVSYENTHRLQEEKLTLGLKLNSRISFELKFSKNRIEKSYIATAISPQSSSFEQTDNLIGISVRMRFSP